MNVAIATKVFGSEVLVALIRHYRMTPSTQTQAAVTLDLTTQLVSTNTRVLLHAGVVYREGPGRGPLAGEYRVDDDRVKLLVDALSAYTLGEDADIS